MRLSTKMRYGTRALAELASAYPHGSLPVKELARRQHLSTKYLEQIMGALKAGGLTSAVRGVNGGHELTQAPSEIKLSDVFRALEGPLMLTECTDHPEKCRLSGDCPTLPLWREITVAIQSVLENTTLQDLLDRWRPSNKPVPSSYQI